MDDNQAMAVLTSLQDAIETLERISVKDLSVNSATILKLDAIEALQRIRAKLHDAGVEPGSNRIR